MVVNAYPFYPSVGPKVGNKQTITLYDYDKKAKKTIISTPEKIDEFVTNREQKLKVASRKSWRDFGVITLLGSAVGALAGPGKHIHEGAAVGTVMGAIMAMFLSSPLSNYRAITTNHNLNKAFIKEHRAA